MTTTQRVLLASGIILIDLAAFVLPLTALLLAYVIIVQPPWFKVFVQRLYGTE